MEKRKEVISSRCKENGRQTEGCGYIEEGHGNGKYGNKGVMGVLSNTEIRDQLPCPH